MSSLTHKIAEASDEKQIWDYRQEFLDCGDSLDGTAALGNAKTFADWFRRAEGSRLSEERYEDLFTSTTYLALRKDDGRLVGMFNVRYRLNEKLLRHGGSIGYSVRPSERRKGYGKEMLRLALPLIRATGQTRALVTCYKENLGSQGVILANGGVFEDEFFENGHTTQRYWIDLANIEQ